MPPAQARDAHNPVQAEVANNRKSETNRRRMGNGTPA
jgi:hypothetical protein